MLYFKNLKKLFTIKNDFFVKKIVSKKEFSIKKSVKKQLGVKNFDEKNFGEKKIFS